MNPSQNELFEKSYLIGSFIQTIYYNEENGYGVFTMLVSKASITLEDERVTVVGHMLRPHEDEVYRCQGEWREHPKFGKQYYIESVKRELPQTKEAIVKYLSSGLFEGIGKKTAQKIVDILGIEALNEITANPDIIMEIKGISPSRAQKLAEQLYENQVLEQALVYLYQIGLGPALALKIVQTYKHQTISLIKENPYRMIEDIEGIGFRRADEMAKIQGLSADARERLDAAYLYTLQDASMTNGHVFVNQDELHSLVDALLGDEATALFPLERRESSLQYLLDEEKILSEEDRYYLPSLYFAEYGLATRIKAFIHDEMDHEFSVADLYGAIGEVEESEQVCYADQQREAITTALSSSLMILTGGPGTGKTTVIKGICQVYAKLHGQELDQSASGNDEAHAIRLVAPTGRAAKRMQETTGLPAMTIHRLLGWRGDFFEHDANEPISGALLIVDEVSMLDIWLANQLFRAIPQGMQVILVGDQDQLPSVGPGQVLQQLLAVPKIPRVQLNEIFRQAEGSSIIELAHGLKKGEVPTDLLTPTSDRRFFSCSRDQVLDVILKTYQNAVHKGYSLFDIQVLAPIYKGPAGVDRINQEIQAMINPKHVDKKELVWGDKLFRLHDKVLQLQNHPEHSVYNGDMGMITAVNEKADSDSPALWVQFDKQEVPYKRSQLSQISLAYACSVHKAQGSEFAIVIFPILYTYRRMLQKKLIYTGITRSKSFLILCGEHEALRMGIESKYTDQRNTCLTQIILEEH
ncbi:ATP-dependent RecD-like DNA helicase [Hazenella sp. IB182357]|uniref:ATP-dependent RecD2 DNA helicase n=1 Tax=Polycladospora coralii TaxID=2771432 RepID=A0A926RT08_9BACL|nr:ATP-dependent RecD-like DNA helicase [Polycladospora coralii]MBD1371068.1 ATP-dependent RecD-like DNA helicase [Polycladospora coralii]